MSVHASLWNEQTWENGQTGMAVLLMSEAYDGGESHANERCAAQHVQLTFVSRGARWIEIGNADVWLVKIGAPRRPHVNRDAVLVCEPQQRSRVGDNRMIDTPIVLWNLCSYGYWAKGRTKGRAQRWWQLYGGAKPPPHIRRQSRV